MTRRKSAKCALIAGIPIAGAALFLLVGPEPGSTRGDRAGLSRRERLAAAHVASRPHAERARARKAAAAPARRADRQHLTRDGEVLQSSVLDLDRPDVGVIDLQDLGSTLTRLLSLRPELGLAAAGLLEKLQERKVLFQVSHALRAVVGDPSVEACVLDVAASDGATDSQREAAVKTLGGRNDPRASALFAALVSDDASPELTRSAAFYELSTDVGQAPAATAAAVQAARDVLSGGQAPDRVGAAALDLLGAAGMDDQDRAVAGVVLDDPSSSENLALAAARALVMSGADRAAVATSLLARVSGDPAKQAIVAMLAGGHGH